LSGWYLAITLVTSALGAGYFMYGKRQVKYVPILCGIALCTYSYFIDSIAWLLVIAAVLLALPFFIDG
jgi:hypothetical protein